MRKYAEATTHLCDIVEDVIVDGKIDYPESSFGDSILSFGEHIQHRHKKAVGAGKNETSSLPYFDVHPLITPFLVLAARTNGEFFDYCSLICSTNIASEMPLPEPLRLFASDVLAGRISRPKGRGSPRKKNWLEQSFLWSLVLETQENFNLSLTRNDEGSNKFSACDAVAEALTFCGRQTSYTEIKNLMVHPDKAGLRAEFEVSRKILSRWFGKDYPQNALSPDYWNFWEEAARSDVLDILAVFPKHKK